MCKHHLMKDFWPLSLAPWFSCKKQHHLPSHIPGKSGIQAQFTWVPAAIKVLVWAAAISGFRWGGSTLELTQAVVGKSFLVIGSSLVDGCSLFHGAASFLAAFSSEEATKKSQREGERASKIEITVFISWPWRRQTVIFATLYSFPASL